jgi:hypothetical protein
VPGVRPFGLGVVTGTQPIYLSVYEVKNISNEEYRKKKPPHNRSDLAVYTRLEFSNHVRTEGGLANRVLGGQYATLETETEVIGELGDASDVYSGHVSC